MIFGEDGTGHKVSTEPAKQWWLHIAAISDL